MNFFDTGGQTIDNLNDIMKEHSPSVPLDFPKGKLPENLCQTDLLKMLNCLNFEKSTMCGHLTKSFHECRRDRDAIIFDSIKEWEIEKVGKLDDKSEYVRKIDRHKKELVKELLNTPTSIANKNRRWRLAADIEQLDWRSEYLKQELI